MRSMIVRLTIGVLFFVGAAHAQPQVQQADAGLSAQSISMQHFHPIAEFVLPQVGGPKTEAKQSRPTPPHSLAGFWNSRDLRVLARRVVITAIVLGLAILLLLGLQRVRRRALGLVHQQRDRIPRVQFRGLELISARTLLRNIGLIITASYVLCFALVVLGAALVVFGQFPATQGYTRQVGLWLWNPLVSIARGIVGYLPNLFYILVILVVTRFILRMVNYVFRAAERGVISLEPWIQRDVARPTGLIIRVVVVVVALFFIAPLVPGTGSTAAKGISVILGLMISFGSTSSVGNFVAGIVLMYMRPFKLGERVRIGETVGDVIERTFLYTKILTIKNEEVMVPSLTALGAPMINYSARAQTSGLIIHTGVTLGYNAPWRQVHELLFKASLATAHILKDPKPFVLQTALDDFYVKYEVNAHTDQPTKMAQIYSDLHQNIQDCFNEAGVEICSPHYRQLRDGNTTTVPAAYWEKDYAAPRFQVESYTAALQR